MPSLHQFVAGFQPRAMRSATRRACCATCSATWGFASEIYCERRRVLPELRKDTRDIETARGDRARATSPCSTSPSARRSTRPSRPEVPQGHPLPQHHARPSSSAGSTRRSRTTCATGRQQVLRAGRLRRGRDGGQPLQRAGTGAHGLPRRAGAAHEARPHALVGPVEPAACVSRYADGKLNVLFVGRCAPNKRIEDLLFALLLRAALPRPRVAPDPCRLARRPGALPRPAARQVRTSCAATTWSSRARFRQDQLRATTRWPSVFLCMSEHEGFCIPLIEAMAHNVPVLAHAAAAVPETLDGAGMLFRGQGLRRRGRHGPPAWRATPRCARRCCKGPDRSASPATRGRTWPHRCAPTWRRYAERMTYPQRVGRSLRLSRA
jgi:glycosyltransferase involved in cell wall biosynthesis